MFWLIRFETGYSFNFSRNQMTFGLRYDSEHNKEITIVGTHEDYEKSLYYKTVQV